MESPPAMKVEYKAETDKASADEEEDEESGMDQDTTSDDNGNSEDDAAGDYIEEEMLVFADFEKYLAQEELTDPNVRIKVIGIETENPIVQINNDLYKGTYDFAMGTNVFLEEDPLGKAAIDRLYSADPDKLYKYAGQSTKVLKMKRIFVTPKTDEPTKVKPEPGGEPGEEQDDPKDNERYFVTRNYEEALNLHLPEGHYPPRHIELDSNCEQVVRRKLTTLAMVESDMEDDAQRDDPNDRDYKPGASC